MDIKHRETCFLSKYQDTMSKRFKGTRETGFLSKYQDTMSKRFKGTRDTYNYGQYLNQFPPNTINVIREFERIQKKICRHKMSIMFNEICINEEMLPIYIYIYIYIYI